MDDTNQPDPGSHLQRLQVARRRIDARIDCRRVVALVLGIAVLGGCGGGRAPASATAESPTATPAVTWTATAGSTGQPSSRPSTPPTDSAPPTATPEPMPDVSEFICSYPYAVDGTTDRAHITDVRVGAHVGYDRIVFEFERGIPAMDVRIGTPPFTYDPSGLPLPVSGTDFLVFIFRGGTGVTPEGRITYQGPTVFTPRYPLLVEFVRAGDFEAQSEWVAGLTGPACINVVVLTGPDRLVIDLAPQP